VTGGWLLTHRPAGIIEEPFVLPGVDMFLAVRYGKIGHNVIYNSRRVGTMQRNGGLG
jgi:hypothetical protein